METLVCTTKLPLTVVIATSTAFLPPGFAILSCLLVLTVIANLAAVLGGADTAVLVVKSGVLLLVVGVGVVLQEGEEVAVLVAATDLLPPASSGSSDAFL